MKRNHLGTFLLTEYFIEPYPLYSVFCLEDEYIRTKHISFSSEGDDKSSAVHVVVREGHGRLFARLAKTKPCVYLGLHYTRLNWIRASYLNNSSSKASLHQSIRIFNSVDRHLNFKF